MQTANQIAFKEWSVVCAALEQGRQSLILRKGGLHEGRDGFRVQHDEFWLFPTGFHQQPDELIPEAWPLLKSAERTDPIQVTLSLYAIVHDVRHITDRAKLARLTGQHIWSEKTVDQRFEYRSPGLFALTVRLLRRETPVTVAVSREMAGCKSWVELPEPLTTDRLLPVLTDDQFAAQRERIEAAFNQLLARRLGFPA